MTTNKRITDLTDYTSVLPYASEMFGVYQPMIGWRSKRMLRRYKLGLDESHRSLLQSFAKNFTGSTTANFSKTDCVADIKSIDIGHLATLRLVSNTNSILMDAVSATLPKDKTPKMEEWKTFINSDLLRKILGTAVKDRYSNAYRDQCRELHSQENQTSFNRLNTNNILNAEGGLVALFSQQLNDESAMAGGLLDLLNRKLYTQLENLFYQKPSANLEQANQQIADLLQSDDPFATFDPKKDIKNVSLSPLGIVHLFRQFFFELDDFLGTPTGHVWLSPGSTVELIEVSTRRVYTEKIIEQFTETTQKTERSTTANDEISEAVKQDNKSDLKLGASLTVNQSWGTGNATGTRRARRP